MDTVILVAAGAAVVLGAAGGLLTDVGPWYANLRKPRWQPPNWLFGPAWTLLLGLWAWSAVIAWRAGPETQWAVLTVFTVNAFFHLLWSPLFFKLRRPDWALVEVVFLWCSVVALVLVLGVIEPRAALLNLPYLAWVSFAAFLNWTIVKLNAPFARV
jgi:tryptophan-rich sensory protein